MSLFNCWDNLIGIDRQCADQNPTSGLFVQDLPFIDLKVADAAVTENEEDGIQLIEKKIRYAIDTVISRVRVHLLKNLELVSNLENDTIGFYQDNLQSVALEAGLFKGIRIKIDKTPYLSLDIHSVSLQVDQTKTINVKVFDLLTGLQVGTDIPIAAVANDIITVEINREYISNKQRIDLIVVWDSGEASTFDTSIHRGFNRSCAHCKETWGTDLALFSGIKVLTGASKIENNLTSINGTNGLSLNYTINCSVDSYICNMGLKLAYGVLQKIGAELMRELQYSRRLSSIVTVQSSNIEKLRGEFEDDYNAFMDEFLNNLAPPQDACFHCNSRSGWKVNIP